MKGDVRKIPVQTGVNIQMLLALVLALLTCSSAYALDLNLHQLTTLVLKNNFDVAISKVSIEESFTGIRAADAAFDTNLSANASYNDLRGTSPTKTTAMSMTASKTFPWGSNLSIPYRMTLTDKDQNAVYAPNFEVKLNQPLLKLMRPNYFIKPRLLGEIDWKKSIKSHGKTLNQTLEKTISQFYKTLEALHTKDIKQVTSDHARQTFDFTKQKQAVGKASYLDVIDTQSALLTNQEAYETAVIDYQNAQEELENMIFGETVPKYKLTHSLDHLPQFKIEETNTPNLIEEAWKTREEVANNLHEIEKIKLNLETANADLLPNVDAQLKASVTDANDAFSAAHANLLQANTPSLQLSVTIQRNVYQYQADSVVKTLNLKLKQEALKLESLKRGIALEVRRSTRTLSSGWLRIKSLEASNHAEKEKFAAVNLKFSAGKIAAYDLERYRRDLMQSQIELLKAKISYRKAIVTFHKTKGTLLPFLLAL